MGQSVTFMGKMFTRMCSGQPGLSSFRGQYTGTRLSALAGGNVLCVTAGTACGYAS